MPKLIGVSIIVEILGLIATVFSFFNFVDEDDEYWPLIFLLAGIIYFIVIYGKYRNKNARHTYEKETKRNMTNLREYDNFVKHEHGLSNSTMKGANNTRISGAPGKKKYLEQLADVAEKKYKIDEKYK